MVHDMQRYKGIIEYCGENYAGMQRQEGLRTIQGTLEFALGKFSSQKVTEIDYCGRTDAGVHAFGQVIHFDLPFQRNDEQILKGINYFLNISNEQIALKSIVKVSQDFHSRFSCKGREYKYYIYNSSIRSPIFQGKMHFVSQKLDVEKMRTAGNFFIGEHDFSSFRGKGCQALSPIKTVDSITISKITDEILEIHICAKSFLYKMVRNIVGLIIDVGREGINLDEITKIFEARDISALPYTAPACGLYFFKASY